MGQGQDAVNPLSMAVYMGAIANGGRSAVPRLIHQVDGALIPASWSTRRTGVLIASDTARNLLRVFRLQERLKANGRQAGAAPVRHVHVEMCIRDRDSPWPATPIPRTGAA